MECRGRSRAVRALRGRKSGANGQAPGASQGPKESSGRYGTYGHSLWLTKRDLNAEGIQTLCQEITRTTDVEMCLEGIYDWIIFLPSKQDSQRGVACRYFGRLPSGEMKIRGLLGRRQDTPAYIREAQTKLLEVLGSVATLAECREKLPEVELLLEGWQEALRSGRVAPERLLITRRLSKDPSTYRVRTMVAEAAEQWRRTGRIPHPGETIRYIVLAENVRRPAVRRPRRSKNATYLPGGFTDKGLPAQEPIARVRPAARVLTEMLIEGAVEYDVRYYAKWLQEASKEVLQWITRGAPRRRD